jgi:hypothetical protein
MSKFKEAVQEAYESAQAGNGLRVKHLVTCISKSRALA